MSKRRQIEKKLGSGGNIKSVAASALSQSSGRFKKSPEGRDLRASSSIDPSAGLSNANDATVRTNAALREGGINYQVEAGSDFDAHSFTRAALKRWRKVATRLAE